VGTKWSRFGHAADFRAFNILDKLNYKKINIRKNTLQAPKNGQKKASLLSEAF